MLSQRLQTKSVKEQWNQTKLIGLVRKQALIKYISNKLQVDEDNVRDRSWGLRSYSNEAWVPIKTTRILNEIENEEDIILCKTIDEAKDILERRSREKLTEEEAQILSPRQLDVETLDINYNMTGRSWYHEDKKDLPEEINKAQKLLSETLVSYKKREEAETWQLVISEEMEVSKYASPDLVLEVLKKGKKLYIHYANKETFGEPNYSSSYYPDVPGVCRTGSQVFYNMKKWKSRKRYNEKARNLNPKKKFIPATIPVNFVYQIYFNLLDSFMTTGVKRFDKTPKKSDAQRYNHNNPLEELIQVYGKRYYYKLNTKSDYFRRIYKVLIVLKTHGSQEKRNNALRDKNLVKIMKEIYPIVSKIKLTRSNKRKKKNKEESNLVNPVVKLYGHEGHIFLRYYKMFLVKLYGFKEPTEKRK